MFNFKIAQRKVWFNMYCFKTKIFKCIISHLFIISLLFNFSLFRCLAKDNLGYDPKNPIIIDSVKDFEAFAEDLEDGNSYKNKFVSLKRDIVIDNHNRNLIKNFLKSDSIILGKFEGDFNGNGHTITIKAKNKSKNSNKVLFKSLGKNAKVEKVKISSSFSS